MYSLSRRWCAPALSVSLLLTAVGTAGADVTGFGDFSQFTINEKDSGSRPTSPAAGAIQLTNGTEQARSIFHDTPQAVSQFTASFAYQASNVDAGTEHPGATFVLENDPRGASAVGLISSGFGYQGITSSLAVALDLNTLSLKNTSTSLFTGGVTSTGGAVVTSPVSLDSGDLIDVQLVYSGSTLTESLVDTKTSASFSTSFLVGNIPALVGGSSAFVGFTAATSDVFGNSTISNFQFTSSAPEPASLGLLGAAALPLLARRRRL